MRLSAAVVFAALVCSTSAVAAPQVSSLRAPAPAAEEKAAENVRVAMRREILPAGGRMGEHRSEGERFIYVVSGRLKVSNLVTGEEQVVGAGAMAAEQAGDWHVAEALGTEPVTLYVIDRAPTADASSIEQRAGN